MTLSQRVLNTVKVFGLAKICGRRGDISGRKLFVLVQTSADLTPDAVPPEVGIEGEAGPWIVQFSSKSCSSRS